MCLAQSDKSKTPRIETASAPLDETKLSVYFMTTNVKKSYRHLPELPAETTP